MGVKFFAGLWLGMTLLLATQDGAAEAQISEGALAQEDEIRELKRQLKVVVEEVERLRTSMAVPEEPELESAFGLGPAASKVYGVAQGLSIAGYAEGVYRNRTGDAVGDGDDFADFTRMVLYVGYKFTDRILFNTELEFEHASTDKDGSVSVEFASLDFFLRPDFNVRAGLLLLPMGFLNEIHEPPFYYGTQRPEPERSIIPSTWRENGAGIFGNLGESIRYRAYVVNGLDASGFDSSGLRGGRQNGSEAKAEDLAFVGRVDVDLTPALRVGGSYYQGNSGHDQDFLQSDMMTIVKLPHVRTRIWELHGEYRGLGGLHFRGLYTQAHVGDAGELSTLLELSPSAPIAERMFGGYAEIAYDLMSLLSPGSEKSLTPFFRFEYLDTQADIPRGFTRDRRRPKRLFIPGIQFKPHANVVLKLDYRNIDTWGTNTADEVSLGLGLVF